MFSYGISEGKLNLLTTCQPLGFCIVPVATPPGVTLHPFRGSSVNIGLMVWGTHKRGSPRIWPVIYVVWWYNC